MTLGIGTVIAAASWALRAHDPRTRKKCCDETVRLTGTQREGAHFRRSGVFAALRGRS
jgi:hypothetical protein